MHRPAAWAVAEQSSQGFPGRRDVLVGLDVIDLDDGAAGGGHRSGVVLLVAVAMKRVRQEHGGDRVAPRLRDRAGARAADGQVGGAPGEAHLVHERLDPRRNARRRVGLAQQKAVALPAEVEDLPAFERNRIEVHEGRQQLVDGLRALRGAGYEQRVAAGVERQTPAALASRARRQGVAANRHSHHSLSKARGFLDLDRRDDLPAPAGNPPVGLSRRGVEVDERHRHAPADRRRHDGGGHETAERDDAAHPLAGHHVLGRPAAPEEAAGKTRKTARAHREGRAGQGLETLVGLAEHVAIDAAVGAQKKGPARWGDLPQTLGDGKPRADVSARAPAGEDEGAGVVGGRGHRDDPTLVTGVAMAGLTTPNR